MPSVVSITAGRRSQPKRRGEYLLVELASPGAVIRTIGVLLRDAESGQVYPRMRMHWEDIEDADERAWLEALQEDFESKIREMGGEAFLDGLEDSVSNFLLLSQRSPVAVDDFERTLDRLYEEHVEAVKVQRFVTHLPLYSLRAAATKFGDDREVEAEEWVKAPPKLRLTQEMFVARVVGRSMEPRIPDGSLCIFRWGVAGSRHGKLVLVERYGATDTSARYTIKKYTSTKVQISDEEWRHESVRLEPLNPEFEGFELKEGESRVIAEFIQVLE